MADFGRQALRLYILGDCQQDPRDHDNGTMLFMHGVSRGIPRILWQTVGAPARDMSQERPVDNGIGGTILTA
jgi:hypothetical protein